jgi:hypothetical protein
VIDVKKIVRQIRTEQKDNNEIKFSDYDIFNALNKCIRYVNQSFSMKNSDFLERSKEYIQDEVNAEIHTLNQIGTEIIPDVSFDKTGVVLPEDYVSLISIIRFSDGYKLSPVNTLGDLQNGGYKIFANKIYCSFDFTLQYHGKIKEVKTFQDTIDMPDMLIDLLTQISGLILNNAETDVLMQAVNDNTNALIPGRRYSNVKIKMPFKI